jgi:hypothetical protein
MGGNPPRQHSADLYRRMAPCGPLYSAYRGPQSTSSDIGGTPLSLDLFGMKLGSDRKIESRPLHLFPEVDIQFGGHIENRRVRRCQVTHVFGNDLVERVIGRVVIIEIGV